MLELSIKELEIIALILRSSRKQGFVELQGSAHIDAIGLEMKATKELERRNELENLDFEEDCLSCKL